MAEIITGLGAALGAAIAAGIAAYRVAKRRNGTGNDHILKIRLALERIEVLQQEQCRSLQQQSVAIHDLSKALTNLRIEIAQKHGQE